ncbi:CppA N-terminal domain-containing protein [Streptococcus suis]|uniref:CppA N-terminal domain-containing protein n=1 Tax=Streptococcus suis TaxID=1307 RepID=UPI001ABEAB09|nr:chemotaxis protein [Streptococcus suis]
MLRDKHVVPVLRVNNRAINQEFIEKNLGLKTLLEDGPFADFSSHQSKELVLSLMESPSARTRQVKGLKKLALLVLKVAQAEEIEAFLATGASYSRLYKGKTGLAFECLSPEGDRFLVHGEESCEDLVEILAPYPFASKEGFVGFSQAQIEEVVLRTPNQEASQAYYQKILGDQELVRFEQAEGDDLQTPAEEVWDLDSLHFLVKQDFDWEILEAVLPAGYFKDKRQRFIQTRDLSGIELRFEK